MTTRDTEAYRVVVDYPRGRVLLTMKEECLTSEESHDLGLALRDAHLCLNNYQLELIRSEKRAERRAERARERRRIPLPGDPLPMEEDEE